MKKIKKYCRILTASLSILVVTCLQANIASAYISNGANAVNVIGQYRNGAVSYTDSDPDNGSVNPNALGQSRPTGITMDTTDHRLFVSDRQNNRVLVYNLNSSNILTDYTADYVLGQSNFTGADPGTTQGGMSGPFQLAFDDANNRLFVADYGNRRVLVYDVTSISNGENAAYVLGQANFTSSTSAATQSGMAGPLGVTYSSSNNYLFVSDSSNSRVLVYDVTSISNGENAAYVLGQADFTSSSGATTQSALYAPRQLDVYDNYLFVSDFSNRRVLVYDVTSISNGENAAYVLGQANFTSSTSATTQSGMASPDGVKVDGVNYRLFVSDSGNNRVLVYDVASTSITNGENAMNVLGQADFTSSAAGTTQSTLRGPAGVWYDTQNDALYVADFSNNRSMVFDGAVEPSGSGAEAPEFSTLTMLGTLMIGAYALQRMRLKGEYAEIE